MSGTDRLQGGTGEWDRQGRGRKNGWVRLNWGMGWTGQREIGREIGKIWVGSSPGEGTNRSEVNRWGKMGIG